MKRLSQKLSHRSNVIGSMYRCGVKIKLYFKYPESFVRDIKMVLRKPRARRLGISYHPPNFIYHTGIHGKSIIVDVGCGFEADFSRHMIEKFGVTAYGIDPTEKHKQPLQQMESSSGGKFVYLQNAVSSKSGELLFYEIANRESGSLLSEHVNFMQDETISYMVNSITLREIPEKIEHDQIDLIKLDIEGAEYDLFSDIKNDDLAAYKQIYIEFHHKSVKDKSIADTRKIVTLLCTWGFKSFTLDDINYLFYRE